MTGLFFASILAGFVLSAPFGPVGALVADAALVHDGRRLDITVASAVLGNGLLAFIVSLGAYPIRSFLSSHNGPFFLAAGAVVMIAGLTLGLGAANRKIEDKGVAPVSVFLLTLLHPGSISAFLFLTAFFVMKIPSFPGHKALFASGVTIGSLLAFGPVGLVFWNMRARAEKFIVRIRYGLAAFIFAAGLYLFLRGSMTVIGG